ETQHVHRHVDGTSQTDDIPHRMPAQGLPGAVIIHAVAQQHNRLAAGTVLHELYRLIQRIIERGVTAGYGVPNRLARRLAIGGHWGEPLDLTREADHLGGVVTTKGIQETLRRRLRLFHALSHGAAGIQCDHDRQWWELGLDSDRLLVN